MVENLVHDRTEDAHVPLLIPSGSVKTPARQNTRVETLQHRRWAMTGSVHRQQSNPQPGRRFQLGLTQRTKGGIARHSSEPV